ncbi:hypothetical protein M1K46_17090 [Fictibacillus sp. WQ 8-8]|uniref:Uncharacterized protein n=1 Tax=Fictibacillus marinisediminis TaxID=2878389 RepID=A0A9X2BFG3_9BACL|nr:MULTISPECIES: hypothetical protein [Fictibacillus]SFD94216.1 hypothetical protein SAMN05428981_102421 [Bacillus sp. OV194]MCK6257307.1 hypothetical protein [Fictibacillus marinisediminis]MCQ6267354.1 hypothetical protein [Fictibacillus sp. WQ 8-8]MED2974833.1 hypothetical protein [Fictibacillus sp. B-59209]UZJ76864.1 hypothetical protein OKX00_11605 [Fictibacillus sp. KU28468]
MRLQAVYFWILIMISTTGFSYLYLSSLFTVGFLVTGLIMVCLAYIAIDLKEEEEWDERQQ